MADPTCAVLGAASPLDPNTLNRFVVGADPAPRKMTSAEIRALGDPVASILFAKGRIPRTAQQTVDMIRAGAPAGDPVKQLGTFVVAEGHEGSQVLPSGQAGLVAGNLRFVVTLGPILSAPGPDVFVSVSDPGQPSGIEVAAWDRKAGGFNWYRSSGAQALWLFAGNSRDALRDLSRRKGPFNSHPSGNLLMKELKTPWIHWDSPAGPMRDNLLPQGDKRRTHKWFTDKEQQGAIDLELAVRASMERWGRARFADLRKNGGTVARPKQVLEQILDTPTANLHTSHVSNAALALTPSTTLDIPDGFFVDADGLAEVGLDPPPPSGLSAFTVSGRIYAKCLTKFGVRLEQNGRKGDTHFCFLVPERAFEDQVVLRESMQIGLVSKRLAACLLMVDPWNPVFSDRRRTLLKYVPPTATIANKSSGFSQEMADRILAAAKTLPASSPEGEFAKRWGVGTAFVTEFNKILNGYYAKVREKVKTQAGFEPYFRLAEERRRIVRDRLPIAQEFPLLMPVTNIPRARRTMQRDATVLEG